MILCCVSVSTSAAISVDRLLALLLGLRYRHVVTLRRVRVVIIFTWFNGASLGSTFVMPIDINLPICFCSLVAFAGNFDLLLHKNLL